MGKLSNKTLLVISNGYPSEDGVPSHVFVKSQVDELKKYFKKIVVISPQPYFPKILNKIEFIPEKYRIRSVFQDYTYDNVQLYFPRFYTLPLQYFRERNQDFALRAVKKCINKNEINFDIIHAHFTTPSGYIARKVSKEEGKAYVLTIQENMNWFMELYNSGEKKHYDVWRDAKTLIRVNKRDVPKLKEYNENTVSIPNGYDSTTFYPKDKSKVRQELSLPQNKKNKKIFLHVGFYKQHHKNQLALIRACKLLKHENIDFKCYLVGGGPDEALFRTKISELELEDEVILVGRVPNQEVSTWMNAADIMVFPSFAEGNPTVVVEALACGLPVIGSKGGGMDEVITEKSGFIVEDQEDEEEIKNIIKKVLDREYDKTAISDYAEEYSQQNVGSRLLKIYETQ